MYLDPVIIPKEDFFEVIVIGAGTCGLAITSRLCEECPGSVYSEDEHQRFYWLRKRQGRVNFVSKHGKPNTLLHRNKKFKPEEILVLDAMSDRFLGQWDSQFAACQIPFLRSPMFFHCDPVNIDGMVSFAHMENRQKDLMEITNVVGKEVSKHKQKRIQQKRTQKTIPLPGATDTGIQDKPGIVDINMRDWKDYYRPSTPFFSDYCKDIIKRYNLQSRVKKDEVISIEYKYISVAGTDEQGEGMVIRTASGKVFGCKIGIVTSGHRGSINYPITPFTETHFPYASCHTTHLFTKQVNFLDERFFNKTNSPCSIVIVGGGLTSAQLAHVAAQDPRIDKVYLLFRGPVKIKHFDFHLDWVTKYKNVKKSAFYILDTDEERARMIKDAREGGSINPEYYKKLNAHVKSGKVDWMKHTEIVSQNWDQKSERWDLSVETKTMGKDHKELVVEKKLSNIRYIYFATGIRADIQSLEFLQPMMKENPIEVVDGFPCLTDNLQWNEIVPLFMSGKNASLRIGPTSANLDGARSGAERIGWYIQDLKAKGKLDWSCCKMNGCCSSESNILSLEDKIDLDCQEESDDGSSYQTHLKLASGQMNWFTLLDST
ncbi:uncharacterized protein J8A68_004492 [[Candida] subhashii]|uniref:L-ornithine N(5)-oxygenase n=1 Tax=[Candida] subhashii TaxID=561895 RepID=A0A8J5QFG2_9ASCO|nr:uncharacterized protein J8A68_004492 [[Candida] subhashii]KAG7661992.1 hypothetical protein J8A68_004492 [[Candida] subhashii]